MNAPVDLAAVEKACQAKALDNYPYRVDGGVNIDLIDVASTAMPAMAAAIRAVRGVAGNRDVLYPAKFKSTPTDNYVTGYLQAMTDIRAVIARHVQVTQ